MGCRYPDARSPGELWENVLAGRRSFRRIPAERLSLGDYLSADRQTPDSTYSTEGAFIEGYEFDRVRFRVAGSVYRAADLAHWLALEVAADAFADAGFGEGEGLPRETTGVFVGNTLTGEFSRANVMRLRWPYVRRVLLRACAEAALAPEERDALLGRAERLYKQPFPPTSEETLAGGLSNTIAGRICNHFDLQGGGYTLDGACASSLLAVINACAGLAAGDLDVALAGGVDLSIDPFEVVGFAKVGALAADLMRVYDARSAGFWPGEGCGLVVLMRHEDALAERRPVYGVIRGWGVSSDGSGGITRPEVGGQVLALRRAYRRAGYGIETVAYFEGHGTGTAVGDATELQALARARREADPEAPPAAIGSIKANIGHTKAAAGVAGLIKAAMAVSAQVIPPTTGCDEPHPELKTAAPALRVPRRGELFPPEGCVRAGVSAMGFGGINAHVTLESAAGARRPSLNTKERTLLASAQDCELFLFDARSVAELSDRLGRLSLYADRISRGELADLAAQLGRELGRARIRAAVVATTPAELSGRLGALKALLDRGVGLHTDMADGVFLNTEPAAPRVGFLFPGQGSPSHADGGAWGRRFEYVRELYAGAAAEWGGGDATRTEVAQPAIVTASLAALRVLARVGITGVVGVGHSLGELTALHWAGALDEESLLRVARERGAAMAGVKSEAGAMLGVAANRAEVEEVLNGERVVIAGLNSPAQTVLSGEAAGIESVMRRAQQRGLRCVRLPVSHAFHSPLVADAVPALSARLDAERFRPLKQTVVSTVTGRRLTPDDDLRALLLSQVTSPVRFDEALSVAAGEGVDLWLEVGPGQTLGGLAAQCGGAPVISLDAGGASLRGLLRAVGACFVLGAQVGHEELFAGRVTRPFALDWRPSFFVNPCELAPPADVPAGAESESLGPASAPEAAEAREAEDETAGVQVSAEPVPTLEVVRLAVAARAELPASAVKVDSRLLDDLHLNSITVAQLVTELARRLNLLPPPAPTQYANATVAEIAAALDDAPPAGQSARAEEEESSPAGVEEWVRAFAVELTERPLIGRERVPRADGAAGWRVLAPADYPLADALREAFARIEAGRGIVVALPPGADERHVPLLLEGARDALAGGAGYRFVLVQHGGGAAAFARTLHLEAKDLVTCVVDVPADAPRAVEWVVAEAAAAKGYTEAHYDEGGVRREPVLRPVATPPEESALPLTEDDVLVVTGGARGITAECALALARETGARLALFGKSRPDENDEIASNLGRMKEAGVACRYYAVDVTDEAAVRGAVRQVEEDFGAVTAVLHGAARNVPCLIENLDDETFRRTLAPKVAGARHLLAAVDPAALRLFITFGSIIARTGLWGEADYGLANEWLTRLTERWGREHPHCRCHAVEWSLWTGVGMGARLGNVAALRSQGVTPITPEQGVAALRRLLAAPPRPVAAVVMGRFREMPTLRVERPELPLLRFLENPRVYYPKVELVAEAVLSPGTDLYLDDHVFEGERLLPAVLGMEAMAQAAAALLGTSSAPVFEQVRFDRPVVVRDDGRHTIRISALARDERSVEVVLRSSETGFQLDHFRAVCVFAGPPEASQGMTAPGPSSPPPEVPLVPERDLYGKLLFHGGRFRRLRAYRQLSATECLAEIMPDGTTEWFSHYLPADLLLGDPGARDAAIHAVQACIPQARLLPVGAERIAVRLAADGGPVYVHAREREVAGNTFVYDLELVGEDGGVRELWEGLRLRAVGGTEYRGPWAEALLGPYVERRLKELLPPCASVVFERDEQSARRERSDRAIRRALGRGDAFVERRQDGKPVTEGARHVSASHRGGLTMAVASPSDISCDIERVGPREPPVWRAMLGLEAFALAELLCRETGCAPDEAATRVWTARECLKKAGAGEAAPLTLAKAWPDGWVLLASGGRAVASWVCALQGEPEPLAVALMVGGAS
jgi:enediyne polyketide synthase